ncbi:hypothetical protein Moror_1106 [Moniliophthora roreri MCA 2997]|uniref:Zn(2)-C6 fungal-type domain-containing protein n=2 Tax=Moniliophthora roreri TaxID=221103 RepID=V2XL24_MONRO|nr:hypothetical protein Moror_1106 [Moniliophthora roreri MCA 2997]
MAETASSETSSSNQQKKSHATSCAECRRLKLKCDRVFPCSSCIRRGCANLCPNGTLEKGRRGFLKRLEQSLPSNAHRNPGDPQSGEGTTEVAMFIARDAAMSKRIQELEAALINAGIQVPGLPHSLAKRANTSHKRTRSSPSSIEEDEEAHNTSPSSERPAASPTQMNNNAVSTIGEDVTIGFGTLTIDPQNRAKYIGLSGASAYLSSEVWNCPPEHRKQVESEDAKDALSSDIQLRLLSKMSALPPYDEALRLAKLYFFNAAYMYEIVQEEIFMKDHITAIYEAYSTPGKHIDPDMLAVVSMVLAIGIYYDLTQSVESVKPRSSEFFEIAVFAVNINNSINGGVTTSTIEGVQALNLMALYQLSVRGEGGAEAGWQLLGMACRSLLSQGLHRDGSRWGLPPKELEERRRVFWETYTFDRLQSFTLGRPYALIDAHSDCEMPSSSDVPLPSDTDGSNKFSHTIWHQYKFRWSTLVGRIVDRAFSVRQLTYAIITEVDREINDFYFSLPSWMHCPAVTRPIEDTVWKRVCTSRPHVNGYSPDIGLGRVEDLRADAQAYTLANNMFIAILLLHRAPFCRALMLEPQKLVRSPYESSVSRVASAATTIINITRGMYVAHPAHTSRVWYWLFHVFTAAVCQAVFVAVAPFHPLAPQAFKSLQAAIQLFERAEGQRAMLARNRVKNLAEKASAAMDRYLSSSFHKSRCKPDVPNASSVNSDAPSTGVAAALASSARFPESYIRRGPEEWLGTSTKLVRLQSPDLERRTGSTGTSASASPISNPPSQLEVGHPSPGQTLSQNQQGTLDSLGLFSSSTPPYSGSGPAAFDPWIQTFMTIGTDANRETSNPSMPAGNPNATTTPNWSSTDPGTGGSQTNNYQPSIMQFDPNSFNDLDFTVDPVGLQELQSLFEFGPTFNFQYPRNGNSGQMAAGNAPPNPSIPGGDVYGQMGGNFGSQGRFNDADVFGPSSFVQDGSWMLHPFKG